MSKTYFGPWQGPDGGDRSRFVVRNGQRFFEFKVRSGMIQLSIPTKQIEDMLDDEWDYDNALRNARMTK